MESVPISAAAFRESLARFASGVTVVGARTNDGLVGFTATGFTSVSLLPPLILVCIGKAASAYPGIVGAVRFGVSILNDRQAWIAEQFARSGIDRFRDVELIPETVPLVQGALAHLACRPFGRHDAGDHELLLGEVLEARVGVGRPLVHFARRFGGFTGEIPPPPPAAAENAKQEGAG